MSLDTTVATIYADKIEQLTDIGFKDHEIRTHAPRPSFHVSHCGEAIPSRKMEPEYYSVSREWAPFECSPSEAFRSALDFLAIAKNKQGKNRAGLDTDITYRCDYSPVYD